ncbi:MAG: phenylalanine--tRNA ligase subunit beta [Actinobacteria bacterium]|nr:phenylalanine--tRNA ligase subunit beta [Actinomycetota bacterium]
MRVPLSWLSDFAPFEGAPEELAATLSDLGLVVEGMERVGEGLDDIVVAQVLTTRPHPSADRVQLVEVDRGDGATTQVVCGAFNFVAGDLVPLAPIGARLPGGLEIGRRKVRGQWSEGMLCSGAELALSDDSHGILILPGGLLPGSLLTEALGISPDVVFDLDVTPNRPDALSVLGVARDLAARLKVPLAVPEPPPPVVSVAVEPLGSPTVAVLSPDLCPRFTATLLTGVVVGPSPGWLASRLTLAGMRPINNVVDVSNYVMLELGQPNHPYDRDLLGTDGLQVRRAEDGEVVTTLDDVERRLTSEDCLICDAAGSAVGIGGIMGGASSEIMETTRTVLLEAAYFEPMAIARTSKRLGLRTEASVRFERGVDPEGIERAVARFCQLAAEAAGAAVAAPVRDVSVSRPPPSPVVVRTSRVNAILGTALETSQIAAYLEPLGFSTFPLNGDAQALSVTIPTWRPDSEREIDVVEEVARHHGYGRIIRTLPPVTGVGGLTAAQRGRRLVRQVLVGAGLSEAWSTSLVSSADLERAGLSTPAVEVENPLAQEESVLRTSLLPGLLRATATNASRRYPDVRLFEVGKVFLPPRDGERLPEEPELVAGILAGGDAGEAKLAVDTLLEALRVGRDGSPGAVFAAGASAGLHPARSAVITLEGEPVGTVGEVDPDVLAAHDVPGRAGWFELNLDALLTLPSAPAQYRPVSRFPSADFDLAFLVEDTVPAAVVEEALRRAADELLEDLWLFDVFRGEQLGEERRSLAFRLRVAALDHTLTEQELAGLRAHCIEAVEASAGASIRT